MRVLLIYPDINTIQFPHFQHGLAAISAVLKKAGHRAELLYISNELSDGEFIDEVEARDPEVMAFSSTTQMWPFALRYAKAARGKLDRFMVVGGIHATIDPERVLSEGVFDALVRGEGEYPLLEILEALQDGREWKGIKNVWAGSGDKAVRNPVRAPVDLSELPWPDRDLFDNDVLMKYNDNQVAVMASRGCPFRCTYCCNTVLSDLAGGNAKWVRQRPVDDVLSEIEDLHKRFPEMKSLIFMDEIFTVRKKWVAEFCHKYKARFDTPFQVFLRVEAVDRETMERMKEAGLYSIIVGVESGNERIRREVLNRKMTNRQIINVFQWADELGLETWDFNMIGVPGDTEQTIRDTMELNRIIRPHHLQISIFYPFPGTPLYDRCIEQGLAKIGESTSVFHSKPVLDLPGISRDRVLELHKEFVALGHSIEAQKSKKGYFDLAAGFEHAKVVQRGDDYVALWRVRIAGDDRMAILMHPPAGAAWQVKVKAGSVMRFGIGMTEDVWDKPGGGVRFRVKVKPRFGKERVIFEEFINPKKNENERRWLDREVSLSDCAGKKVGLTLETEAGQEDNRFCAAFWSRPYIESGATGRLSPSSERPR